MRNLKCPRPGEMATSTCGIVPKLPLQEDVLEINALYEKFVDEGFSEDFMRRHTRQEDLNAVFEFELQVDAVSYAQRCEMIGELLPNLSHLRLSQSRIGTVRDLGTSLLNLKVLWLSRSSLQDLGGITNVPLLEELYISFNDVKDLSPLWMLESLQVLDLEGNLIDDFDEINALQAVITLRELNLNLNPVCKLAGYSRAFILERLPQLEVLDDFARFMPMNDGLQALACPGGFDDTYLGNVNRREAIANVLSEDSEPQTENIVPGVVAPASEEHQKRAIQELRDRSSTRKRSAVDVGTRTGSKDPVPDGDSVHTPQAPDHPSAKHGNAITPRMPTAVPPRTPRPRRAGAGGMTRPTPVAVSRAISELRAGRARLKEGAEPLSDFQFGPEPTEMDLVVEGVKKTTRPMPSLITCAKTARGDFAGGAGRWSDMFSLRREDKDAASDLTSGNDGSALVGNPLGAARLRRRGTSAGPQGSGPASTEDGLGIRSLLRRFDGSMESDAADSVALEEPRLSRAPHSERPRTPDVRIRMQAPRTPRPLIATTGVAGRCGFHPYGRSLSARPSTSSASTTNPPTTASSSRSSAFSGGSSPWTTIVAGESDAPSKNRTFQRAVPLEMTNSPGQLTPQRFDVRSNATADCCAQSEPASPLHEERPKSQLQPAPPPQPAPTAQHRRPPPVRRRVASARKPPAVDVPSFTTDIAQVLVMS